MDASQKITEYIASLPTWQRNNLAGFRKLIHEVVLEAEEAWKWSVPVFLVDGKLVCAMSTFIGHTKYNFFEGASLKDEHKLFNSGLDSKKHRSINLQKGQRIDKGKLRALIKEAVEQAIGQEYIAL
jgi:hypothetical protein